MLHLVPPLPGRCGSLVSSLPSSVLSAGSGRQAKARWTSSLQVRSCDTAPAAPAIPRLPAALLQQPLPSRTCLPRVALPAAPSGAAGAEASCMPLTPARPHRRGHRRHSHRGGPVPERAEPRHQGKCGWAANGTGLAHLPACYVDHLGHVSPPRCRQLRRCNQPCRPLPLTMGSPAVWCTVQVIAVEPTESPVISGGEHSPHLIQVSGGKTCGDPSNQGDLPAPLVQPKPLDLSSPCALGVHPSLRALSVLPSLPPML